MLVVLVAVVASVGYVITSRTLVVAEGERKKPNREYERYCFFRRDRTP